MKYFILSAITSSIILADSLVSNLPSAPVSLLDDSISTLGFSFSKDKSSSKNLTVFYQYSLLMGAGLRFEYSKNFNNFKELSSTDINKYGIYALYKIPILETNFSITPKAGLVKTKSSFTVAETYKKITDKKTNFTYGVDLNYKINDALTLFLNYTDYGKNIRDIEDLKLRNLDAKNLGAGIKLDL